MIDVLRQEAAADLQAQDNCIKQLHDIESQTQDLTWKIEVNDAEITKLSEAITKLEGLETKTIADTALVGQQITDMTSNRTQENSDFLAAKSDDVKAIELLEQAKDALDAYYANHSVELGPTESGRAALLQIQNSSNQSDVLYTKDDAPDMEFAHKSKGKLETRGVIALLETIIEDLNTEIVNAVKAEEEAQLQYEAQKKAAEDLKATLVAKQINLASDIAARKGDRTTETNTRNDNQGDLDGVTQTKTDIEPQCNQIQSKFDDRKAKREAEMEGLRQAREFLAGYQVSQGDGSDAPGAALLAKGHPQVARLRGPVNAAVRRHA